jgi:hypothetical protein
VSLYNGPDGGLYIVDMYRGIIQHKTYLTDYLKDEIERRDLSGPLDGGKFFGKNDKLRMFTSRKMRTP